MKTSKFLLSTLVAAAAMTSSAYADTTVGETVYAGGIYTFGGWNNANFHNGGYIRNGVSGSALTNVEFGGTGDWLTKTSDTFPSIASLFSSANSGTPLNTLRFVSAGDVTIDGEKKTLTAREVSVSFSDLRLGGLIVESGASGNSIVKDSKARTFQLGDSTNAKTFVGTINEDFTLSATNMNFYGSQNWTIANEKTLTITIANTGTVNGTVNLRGAGNLSVGTLSGAGRIDLGSAGNLTISNGTKFNNWTGTVALSDRTISHTAFAMNSHGTTGSTIELSGVDGVFAEFAGTVNANLHLTNSETSGKEYGFKAGNGASKEGFTLAGKITGNGDLVMGWSTGTSFYFTGNLSEYEGKILNSTTKNTVDLKFTNTTLSDGETSITGTGDIDWKGNIYYNYTADVTAENKIVSGNLTKQGAGALTLSGANSYTGGTTVAAGTLIAGSTSAFGSGNLTVASDASLSSGAYAVDLTSGNATINGTYIVTAEGSLKTTGTITLSEGSIVDISALESAGDYTIFSAGSLTNSGATFKTSHARDTATLSNEGVLTFAAGVSYSDLVWTSGVWKDGEKSWTRPEQEGTFDFQAGDSVTFSTADASVTVEGTVAPENMLVSANTTLTGSGTVSVSAPSNINFSNNAKLTIGVSTILDVGTLTVESDLSSIIGEGTISLASKDKTFTLSDNFSGTLEITGSDVANQVNLGSCDLGGTKNIVLEGVYIWSDVSQTFDQKVEVRGSYAGYKGDDETWYMRNALRGPDANFTFNDFALAEDASFGIEQGIVAFTNLDGGNGTLHVTEGTVSISGAESSLGTLHLSNSNGKVSLNDRTGADAMTTTTLSQAVSGSTLNIGDKWTVSATDVIAGEINVNAGGVFEVVGANNNISRISGTVNVNAGGTLKLSGHDALGYNNKTAAGSIIAEGTTDALATIAFADTGKLTLSKVITLKGHTLVKNDDGNTQVIKAFGGGFSAEGSNNKVGIGIEMGEGNLTFDVASGGELDVSGIISGGKSWEKSGKGTLTLSGTNTYTGGTTISGGTLVAANTSALGSGAVSVESGAVLTFATTVNAGTVTLAEGAKFALDLSGFSSGVSDEDSIALNILSATALTFNGVDAGQLSSDVIGSYFDAGNSNLGDYTTYLREWSYANNTLTLTLAIPEPSMFGLLAGLGALALVGTRRRRK